MYNLELTKGLSRLHQEKKSGWSLPFQQMSEVLEGKIQIGTDLLIHTDNIRPQKHRGQYFVLFMQEFDMVNLLYLDTQGNLRLVYNGAMNKAVDAIYNNIADGMKIKVLKSSNKRAYRVAVPTNQDEKEFTIVSMPYKNKSSQVYDQVYLNLYDAINYAVMYFKTHPTEIVEVITPKDTILVKIVNE